MQHWKDHGYVVIERFLSPDELRDITEGLHQYLPSWEEYKARPSVYSTYNGERWVSHGVKALRSPGVAGKGIASDFPYNNDALNNLAVHPFMVAFAERIAGTTNLALTASAVSGKYSGRSSEDQSLHSDYQNNTPVVPGKDNTWLNIPMITYLTDVTIDTGPTYVVSQTETEPLRLMESGTRMVERDHCKDCAKAYELQKPVVAPAGSVLIYSMRTIHRGSYFKAKDSVRYAHFGGFRTANANWMAPVTYSSAMGTPEMERFLLNSDPAQRSLIGMPEVGHDYWKDPDVLIAMSNRYPEMDMRPYGGQAPKVTTTT